MFNRIAMITLALILLASCATPLSHYTVDPEISLASLPGLFNKTIMLEVIPPLAAKSNNEPQQYLNADSQFSEVIKKNILHSLTPSRVKISVNKHFSDVSIRVDFQQLEVKLTKGLIKDELEVTGEVNLELKSKQRSFNKTFKRMQALTVALNANQAEVTGLTNEVVGSLIRTAFEDTEVQQFINQNQ